MWLLCKQTWKVEIVEVGYTDPMDPIAFFGATPKTGYPAYKLTVSTPSPKNVVCSSDAFHLET